MPKQEFDLGKIVPDILTNEQIDSILSGVEIDVNAMLGANGLLHYTEELKDLFATAGIDIIELSPDQLDTEGNPIGEGIEGTLYVSQAATSGWVPINLEPIADNFCWDYTTVTYDFSTFTATFSRNGSSANNYSGIALSELGLTKYSTIRISGSCSNPYAAGLAIRDLSIVDGNKIQCAYVFGERQTSSSSFNAPHTIISQTPIEITGLDPSYLLTFFNWAAISTGSFSGTLKVEKYVSENSSVKVWLYTKGTWVVLSSSNVSDNDIKTPIGIPIGTTSSTVATDASPAAFIVDSWEQLDTSYASTVKLKGRAFIAVFNDTTSVQNGNPVISVNGSDSFRVYRIGPTGNVSFYGNPVSKSRPMLVYFTGDYWLALEQQPYGGTDFTNTLSVSKGGTGKAAWVSGRLLYASSTTALSQIATASGALYATSGSVTPIFGVLPVAQGGTGATSLSSLANALAPYFSGSSTKESVFRFLTYDEAMSDPVYSSGFYVTSSSPGFVGYLLKNDLQFDNIGDTNGMLVNGLTGTLQPGMYKLIQSVHLDAENSLDNFGMHALHDGVALTNIFDGKPFCLCDLYENGYSTSIGYSGGFHGIYYFTLDTATSFELSFTTMFSGKVYPSGVIIIEKVK